MFLIKRANGYYYLHYDDETGRRISISTKTKLKSEANLYFAAYKENITKNTLSDIPLIDFRNQYLSYSKTNHSPQNTVRVEYALRHFIQLYPEITLNKITPQHLEAFKAHRLEKVSGVTVNLELRTLKSFFNTALKWELIEKSPFHAVRMVRIPEQHPAYLSLPEIQVLLSAMNMKWLRDVTLFALNTGLRRGELINIKWNDIDFSNNILFIRNTNTFTTKSRTERTIPLNKQAINILRDILRTSEYVFTNSMGGKLRGKFVSECFHEKVIRTGINSRIHFHSLRHTFATYLVKKSVDLFHIQKLLGHSTISVTMGYSHLASHDLHEAVNKLSIPITKN